MSTNKACGQCERGQCERCRGGACVCCGLDFQQEAASAIGDEEWDDIEYYAYGGVA